MLRKVPVLLVAAFVLLLAAPLLAQSEECTPQESLALLPPADPAYDDAIDLVRTLSEHGFTIKCVLMSKMAGEFKGQEGAALYRTTDGDFDALFLSKPKTFDDLKVVERQLKKGFVYSFVGKPSRGQSMGSVRRQYFEKHDNQLLILSDDALRTKLEGALNITAGGQSQ